MKPGIKLNWYPDETKFIMDNYMLMTDAQLLEHINRFRSQKEQVLIGALRHERHRLGCNRMTQDRWLKRETKFLRGVYTLIGDIEIAKYLTELSKRGRVFTKKNIDKKRSLLGLKRTPEQLQRIKDDHKLCGSYKHGKTWETRGAAAEQETRIWRVAGRKVRFIKINGSFTPYARWYYLNHIGPIPDGYQVYHKDDDPLNDNPDNLILLSGNEIVRRRNAIRKAKGTNRNQVVAHQPGEMFDHKQEWF